MIDPEDLESWERVWTIDKDRYVLIRPGKDSFHSIPTIFDVVDFVGFHIESDELSAELVKRMTAAGVPLVDDRPVGINPVVAKQLELIDAGVPAAEINRVVRKMRDDGIGCTNPLFKNE